MFPASSPDRLSLMTDATREPPVTGHATVDEAIAGVAALDEQPVGEHVAAFENAHALLRRALTETAPAEPDADPGV